MSEQAMIDGLRFAREGHRLQGIVPLARLPRVAEVLFERTGNVSYDLTGRCDRDGKPAIEVQVRSLLALVCQRCLDRLDFALERNSRLLLAQAGEAFPSIDPENSDTETVPVELVADVLDLVEQEVLLGIPLAPAHPEGKCNLPVEPLERKEASPFSVLAQLKAST